MNTEKIFKTNEIPAYWIVRLIFGYVFLVAGLQKFIFYDTRGPGRFMDMGFPFPEFTAYFVGFFEVLCAMLILFGLATRLAAIPLIIIMTVAIITTKLPQLGEGFWTFAHALRLDFSMLMVSLFVLFNGADKQSFDEKWFNRDKTEAS